MQKSDPIIEFSMFPIPTDLLDAMNLDPSDTIQYSLSQGRLIIEVVDKQTIFGPGRGRPYEFRRKER